MWNTPSDKQLVFYSCCTLCLTFFVSYFVILPLFIHTALYIFPILIIGSLKSLENSITYDKEGSESPPEILTKQQAMLFPFIGSGVLLSLYCLYKLVDPWWVNVAVKMFIIFVQFGSLSNFLSLVFFQFFSSSFISSHTYNCQISFWPVASKEKPFKISTTLVDVISYIFSLITVVIWIFTRSWLLQNIFAISISVKGISMIYGGSFTVLTILLSGLFVYDIFWVFGTKVMVTVALSIDAPMMVIFPTSFSPHTQSILGLGDIVIPGIFIAMCLRFDFFLRLKKEKQIMKKALSPEEFETASKKLIASTMTLNYNKVYFWVVLFFYELGMITTGAIMFFFKHPQPALLYLVPYCLFSLYGLAVLNGETKEVLNYQDNHIWETSSPPPQEKKEVKQE